MEVALGLLTGWVIANLMAAVILAWHDERIGDIAEAISGMVSEIFYSMKYIAHTLLKLSAIPTLLVILMIMAIGED